MMSYNEMNYRKCINVDYEFKISINVFRAWLKEHKLERTFFSDLKKFHKFEIDDLYYFAWDYNIPIIMVKYFITKLQQEHSYYFSIQTFYV